MRRLGIIALSFGFISCSADPIVDATGGGSGTDTSAAGTSGDAETSGGATDATATGDEPVDDVLVDGVSATTVRTLGVAVQTGATRDLGILMTQGIQAALEADDGPLRLQHFARDDGYVPSMAASIIEEITDPLDLRPDPEPGGGASGVEGRAAFAILGSVGAPSAARMLPVIKERGVPFVGTLGGGLELYEDPPAATVWQFRPSHAQEASVLTRWLLETASPVPAANVFVFAESPEASEPCDLCEGNAGTAGRAAEALEPSQTVLNAYGTAAFGGIRQVLEAESVSAADMPLGTYRANSTEVSAATDYFVRWVLGVTGELSAQVPTDGSPMRIGVVMAPTALPGAEFIRTLAGEFERIRAGEKPQAVSQTEWEVVEAARLTALSDAELRLAMLSPVGDTLPKLLGNDDPQRFCGVGEIVVSQVVPFPWGSSAAAVAYREDLAASFPNEEPGFGTFEGWIVGKLWAQVIRTTVEDFGDVTEQNVFATMSTLAEPNDVNLSLDWADHQASGAVYGARINEDCVYEEFSL